MREIIIKNSNWEGFHINRVHRFLKGKQQMLVQVGGHKVIRKHGKDFIRLYVPNNRRVPHLTFRTSEVEAEVSIALLLEKF